MPGSSITSSYTNPVSPLFFSRTLASFNVAAKNINLGTTHNFTTGQPVYVTFPSNPTNHGTGLNAFRYFAIVVDATTIQLAATSSEAIAGNSVSFIVGNSSVSVFISKINSREIRFFLTNISLFPCYAQSHVVFNSNTPVEINISYPPYQSIYNAYPELTNTDLLIQVCGLTNTSLTASWYCAIGSSFFTMVQLVSNSSFSDTGIYIDNAPTLGWKQKYVITSDRKIQMWAGSSTSTNLTLIHTSTAIAANTDLILRYGASFNNLSISDCTIKYL